MAAQIVCEFRKPVHLLDGGTRPTIYVFPRFGGKCRSGDCKKTAVAQLEAGGSITDGFLTACAMGGGIREQALVIPASKGLVIVRFKTEYGENFIQAGAGSVIVVEE
ncbi:hypothetical protein ACFLV7_11645 [Chloroflexota bacterium]